MAFGQFPQMFGHLKERGIALLAGPHCDDLSGVFPRPRHGDLPEFQVGQCLVFQPAIGCRLA